MNNLKITFFLFFVFVSFGLKSNNEAEVEFKIAEFKKEKDLVYVTILMSSLNNHSFKLDSFVKANSSLFNFYGMNFIKMVCNDNMIEPKTYLFEDNLSGIRPYYTMIVGFDRNLICNQKVLSIELNQKKYLISY